MEPLPGCKNNPVRVRYERIYEDSGIIAAKKCYSILLFLHFDMGTAFLGCCSNAWTLQSLLITLCFNCAFFSIERHTSYSPVLQMSSEWPNMEYGGKGKNMRFRMSKIHDKGESRSTFIDDWGHLSAPAVQDMDEFSSMLPLLIPPPVPDHPSSTSGDESSHRLVKNLRSGIVDELLQECAMQPCWPARFLCPPPEVSMTTGQAAIGPVACMSIFTKRMSSPTICICASFIEIHGQTHAYQGAA